MAHTLRPGFERRALFLLAAWLPFAVSGSARAGLHVWTLTETRHVLRSEPPADPAVVTVAAARNERVSFQILLRCDTPIKAINLEAGDLKGPGDSRLPAGHAFLTPDGPGA
jgi:hypothetical protein